MALDERLRLPLGMFPGAGIAPTPQELRSASEQDFKSYQAHQREQARSERESSSNRIRNGVFDFLADQGLTDEWAGRGAAAIDYLPLVGDASGAEDTQQAAKAGNWGQAALSGTATAIGAVPLLGDLGAAPLRAVARAVGKADDVLPDEALAPTIKGSFNPLDDTPFTVGGRNPNQWTEEDWLQVDEHFGGKGLIGRTNEPEFVSNLANDAQFAIPGGFEGKFSYRDMLNLKSQGIDPSDLDPEVHQKIHDKMVRSVQPQVEGGTDADVWNGLVFGLTSPNNPLFPNQLAMSRLRLRGDDTKLLDELASSIDWAPGDKVPVTRKLEASADIANKLGLQAAGKGGLGARGSADYTAVAELAKMFKENPGFFRKQPTEEWADYVERLNSQTSGLSAKTGSFGSVWQDPVDAGISAVDRHMAEVFRQQGGLFENATHQKAWEDRGLALWNKKNPDRQFKTWDELAKTSGTGAHVGDMLLGEVNKHSDPLLRTKGGAINPSVPEHLKNVDWVVEPKKVQLIGDNYKRALATNQKNAKESGQGLFSSQWMLWDRQRRRLEPHENMHPALARMFAPSVEQLREVDAAHAATGHKDYGKIVDKEGGFRLKPTRGGVVRPEDLAYFGLTGAGAYSLLNDLAEDDGATQKGGI